MEKELCRSVGAFQPRLVAYSGAGVGSYSPQLQVLRSSVATTQFVRHLPLHWCGASQQPCMPTMPRLPDDARSRLRLAGSHVGPCWHSRSRPSCKTGCHLALEIRGGYKVVEVLGDPEDAYGFCHVGLAPLRHPCDPLSRVAAAPLNIELADYDLEKVEVDAFCEKVLAHRQEPAPRAPWWDRAFRRVLAWTSVSPPVTL